MTVERRWENLIYEGYEIPNMKKKTGPRETATFSENFAWIKFIKQILLSKDVKK